MTKYQKRISGPLLDRIDIHIQTPRVEYEKLSDSRLGEKSSVVQAHVEAARQIQRQRFAGTSVACNADMQPTKVRQYCAMDDTCRAMCVAWFNDALGGRLFYHSIQTVFF